MAHQQDYEIGRKIIGPLMKELLTTEVTMMGDFQETREQLSLTAVRTSPQEAAPHRLRQRYRSTCHSQALSFVCRRTIWVGEAYNQNKSGRLHGMDPYNLGAARSALSAHRGRA